MIFDAKDITEKLKHELDGLQQNVRKPNILLAGATGVGKSSLINLVFGQELAKAGTGKPLTAHIDLYEKDDSAVRLYDSRGYEAGDDRIKEFMSEVVGLADKFIDSPEEQIHLVWYCINAAGHRITDYDLSAIAQFVERKLPIAVVFTKCELIDDDSAKQLHKIINAQSMAQIFETSAKKPEMFEDSLKRLISWSNEQLPDQLRESFIKSQKASLSIKWETAHRIIIQHSAAAFAIGFIPVPMSDAPLLVANQMTLIARVLYIYDLDRFKDILTGGLLGVLISSLGKSIVSSLLKLIPLVGWIVGGAISGSVASVLTVALGEAVSGAAYGIYEAAVEGDITKVQKLMQAFGGTVSEVAAQYFENRKSEASYKEPK